MTDKITYYRVKYSILRFWKELLTAFIAVILYILAFWLISEPKQLLFGSIVITLLGLITTIVLLIRSRDFYYLSFTTLKDLDKWFGMGHFKHDRVNQCYSITQSEPGYIFAPTLLWDDYTLAFDFKIVDICLGVIMRAVNLSNYAMLQITEKGIRPHIRINGGWSVQEEKEAGLAFRKNSFSKDDWYRCTLSCDKNVIDIKIVEQKQSKTVLNRQWTIPSGTVKFQYPNADRISSSTDIYYPINLEYGSFGFRNAGLEKGLIKNMRVRKI